MTTNEKIACAVMPRNTELFDRIADEIEQEPWSYDQSWWGRAVADGNRAPLVGCKTAFCIAGHAANLTGCKPMQFVDSAGRGRVTWEYVIAPGDTNEGPVARMARELLGLNIFEGERLFHEHWKPPAWETVPQALRRIGRGGEINSALVQKPVVQVVQHACTPDPLVEAVKQAQRHGVQ